MENKVIAKEYVDKNYIEIQLIEQKIWNDLENLYTLAEKDSVKEWGRYDLARERKDYLEEKQKNGK